MFRAAMLGKISVCNISSYAFASARFVHPCQMRAIIWSKSKSKRKRKRLSHAHYLVTAIDVDDLPGDRRGSVAGEKNPSGAELSRIATALQWRAFLIMFQHRREPADSTGGQRLHRPSGNAVYPDFFRTEIVGKIARARFETGLGYAHHVVMRHDLFRPVISHRDDASAVGHLRRYFTRERHQRVSADIVRDTERFARRAHKIAFQRLSWRECQRMQHQIDAIGFVPHAFEKCSDLIVARNVAGEQRRFFPKFTDQLLDVFL